MMKVYRHADVRILDGGKAAWQNSGRDYVASVSEFEASTYPRPSANQDLLTHKPDIETRLTDPAFVLVDGRPSAQFTGESPGRTFHQGIKHRYPGHIYGAKSVPWTENFNPDGTFKSSAELQHIYASHGISANKTAVTYCNEGLHAASPWFVLKELLGYPDVRLYDASMAEWANVSDTHLVLGEHCM